MLTIAAAWLLEPRSGSPRLRDIGNEDSGTSIGSEIMIHINLISSLTKECRDALGDKDQTSPNMLTDMPRSRDVMRSLAWLGVTLSQRRPPTQLSLLSIGRKH